MQPITSKYKFSILFIGCLILFSQANAQAQSSEWDIKTLIQRSVKFYPLAYEEWETNTKLYFGYHLKLRFQEGQVTGAEFSQETPLIVLRRNETLIQRLNTFILEKGPSEMADGLHIFPIICEMIVNPQKELQNNLDTELEKIIPKLDDGSGESVIVHKPMLLKIYPPQR